MTIINFPLGNWSRPDAKEIDAIVAAIGSTADQPVFVHCKRGSDRTGTVIAVYRMTHDRWTPTQASDEAKQFGLGWWQTGMRNFIDDYYRDHILSFPAK
jgi:protein tyrosine/serine phosphatase